MLMETKEQHVRQSEASDSTENLRIFNAARSVPDTAKRQIRAGKLKGMTNVAPIWRVEKLTELFGPVGFGWVIENENWWIVEGAGEAMVNCSLQLRVYRNGDWSAPINGIGGSKLYGKGVGDGINDEAYKMAETDALSVACKSLGLAADVYYGFDDTKYEERGQEAWIAPPALAKPAAKTPSAASSRPVLPSSDPQPQQTLLDELNAALEEARTARSQAELVAVWNRHKANFAWNSEFKAAIKNNPYNPHNAK